MISAESRSREPGADFACSWSPIEKAIYAVTAVVVICLAYAYCFHINRTIYFDEIGLHNPIYMYLTTGRMTYPMHGQWSYMVVHPPTHYFAIALLMKVGLPLFMASAVPIWTLTVALTAIIYTGRFSFPTALALLLGFFCAFYIWSEFLTVRPDLMVTSAWFVGLVALQAGRNQAWSPWRLFLGSMLMVYAACCHYWGVASLFGILVFVGVLIHDLRRHLKLIARPLAAIVLGGSVVGIPFLVFFVIPYHQEILEMIRGVQGTGGAVDAFERHLSSYDTFSERITLDVGIRWLVSVLTAPALLFHVPAIFVAFPILMIWRELRVLACAGVALPLFVLFYSQRKQIGYTGYFTPEMILYLVSVLFVLLRSTENVYRVKGAEYLSRVARSRVPLAAASAALSVLALMQVPTSSGYTWSWTRMLDALETQRAAALEVLGPHAIVGTISAGNWYIAGGEYLWSAFNELTTVNREHVAVASYLSDLDALVVDNNYWNAAPEYAPVGDWYMNGDLKLRGFVFPDEPTTIHMMNYFVVSKRRSITGFLIKKDTVERFDEMSRGPTGLIVFICQSASNVPIAASAFYKFAYAYDAPPGPKARQMVFILASAIEARSIIETEHSCAVRDFVRGRLTKMTREELKKKANEVDEPIKFNASHDRLLLLRAEELARARSITLDDVTSGIQ